MRLPFHGCTAVNSNLKDSVSIVMAVYNGREFFAEQLGSILLQLRPSDELIIVDDASTDGGPQIPDASTCPSVRLLTNPTNLGVAASFQRGLSLAQREVVFLCDQDDVWLPGKRLAFMAEFARDSSVSVVVSDAVVIDGKGNQIAPSFMATRGGFTGSVLGTFWRNRFLGCSMAVRRSLLEIALPFPNGVPMHDMWIGIIGALNGRVVYLPVPYLRYRRHGSNLTSFQSPAPWRRRLWWRVSLLFLLVRRLLWLRFRRRT
ncbi:MAG: glycosyltransferase [Terriglobales bacterium]